MDGRMSAVDDEGSVQFREIHKNGWLRRVDKSDKELNRFWVAFCVHDDTEPRLEGFVDQKQATTHSPMWAHSLRNALYLSPTLCATQKNDYEFCINFNDDRFVRLAASTYQVMCDWVHVVTRKLTDMKILRPKENIYSKGPERIATRDPTSPLPPPPVISGSLDHVNSTTAITIPSSSSSTNREALEESSPLNVFTFDDVHVDERRPRVQTQALRSAPTTPSPRPSLSPAPPSPAPVLDDNSSYESIFLASSSTSVPTEELSRMNINEQNSSSQNNGGNERYVALMDYRSAAGIRNPVPPPRSSGDVRLPGNTRQLLTLREQQVAQLKNEISHPAGVRLQLGRRDCKDSIAFVEVYGGIWVAGWKQRDHPMLYNVLHIGDLVLSIAGIVPTDVAAIKNILRNYSLPRVDVVVKRLPHAKVLILKKNSDAEGFGIDVFENEIFSVSEAAQTAGLTLFTSPVNQNSPSDSRVTWCVTELNGRPLNIFDGRVSEKVRAVGCDVTLVVQPSDLVESLRRRLQRIRGYKLFLT